MGATLTQRRSPWVVFTRHDDPWLSIETAELQKQGGRLIRLDGRKLRDPGTLFATFARELSFPGHFGHNWDALVDCLHDWHGHGGDTKDIAVLIDNADCLLSVEFLGLFVSVLCQAAWRANLQLDADGVRDQDTPPFTLHFVFLLDSTALTAFAMAAANGTDVGVEREEGRLTATLTGEDWPDAGSEPSGSPPTSQ
ncbi:barstar family protein [Streptomyces sp. BA2]|uniref:barstar family protein n=1 Tax=Streptomyces sp. BA2 TaxID=436595 RepID=UPI001367E6B4